MSRLSHLSEHSAAAVCKGPSSLNARCLPGGEGDVSSYLSPRRKRSFLTVASIGWAPVALFSVAVRACVLPCVNEKVLMVNSAVNEESVVRLAAR
ncbi:hypothetical protein C4Z12_011195 [Klebsiella pneumoniae subsp. pneumoniae]|uniref:hypothetical protein n=1 Tax=Klebsiella pneumoniae complex TaxID=3390273 RepID=UPI00090730E4|nr:MULTISPECIES: hypothetical protein [Klebsiella]ORC47332.1 hypothetical protein B2D09_21245 [Klebsiella pneumoniae subsp. pneumoniae]TNK07747.1 hypothetical protein CI664_009590 [Klebsiella quasipneumoniae subsp. similipneumoniae]ELA0950724.1 hypothetical protein [Klebsiella pneumoniae]MEC4082796.1 hypothetical protein [Klebsiella pneumoniae]ROD46165.1 hypothetical protein C4Z12_011195 [Klebsiella pneumoniae subsp. pneumoniae]